MAEIIDMENRRSLSQKDRDAIRKKRKILAVQDDWIESWKRWIDCQGLWVVLPAPKNL